MEYSRIGEFGIIFKGDFFGKKIILVSVCFASFREITKNCYPKIIERAQISDCLRLLIYLKNFGLLQGIVNIQKSKFNRCALINL